MADARCRLVGCTLPVLPRRHRCYEHWLAKQPPVVRYAAAERRRELIPDHLRKERVPKSQWPPGRRWCSGCQAFILLEHCSGSRCRDCAAIFSYIARLKNEFGIDPATYQWLLERQLGRCAICRQRPSSKRLAVDHDHTCCKVPPYCGKCVRGLLCSHCNHDLLGAGFHSAQIFENAANYLTRPPFQGEWEPPAAETAAWEAQHGKVPPAPY